MKPEKAYRELIVLNRNVEIIRKRETNVDEKTTCWRWEPNPHLPHYVCCALSAILPSTSFGIRVRVQQG